MDEKSYRALKARIAYREFVKSLPKCTECDDCMCFEGRGTEVLACMRTKRIVDNRVKTCPIWCPIRED